MDETWWSLITIIGPAILLVALVWLAMKRRNNRSSDTTEAATRATYAEEEARRREGTDGL